VAGEEVEALALGRRNNAGTGSSSFESRRAGWKSGKRKPGPPVGVLGR
jgi:hypothetical protein